MPDSLNPLLQTEIATAAGDPFNLIYNGLLRPDDDTLASRGGGKGLRIYDEIERDCHAWSVLQKRKLAVIARPLLIEAASDSRADRKARDLVEAQLKAINFDHVYLDLLDALLKGYAVAEIIWCIRDGQIAIDQVMPRDQRRFVFDAERQLRLLSRGNLFSGVPVPERKFLVHRFGAKDGNPYGKGLGTRLFWPVWFKRQGIQFWLTFADKFGSPTAIGTYPAGTTSQDQTKLLAALAALAQDTGVAIPAGMEIKLLEAARSGTVNTYESLCRYMDEEISKAVLGETLSTSMGKSGGSFAASKTHNEVRLELVQADADLLADSLSGLAQWIVDFNLPGAKPPAIRRDCKEPEDLKTRADRDKTVSSMGFKPTLAYIRETYGEGWEDTATPVTAMDDAGRAKSLATAAFSETGAVAEQARADQHTLQEGASQLASKHAGVFRERLAALLALLDETGDLALFAERLSELLSDNSSVPLQESLGRARFTAHLLGRLAGQP